jgi:signal transduction histidine kinase
MGGDAIRVLLVEDDPDQAELVRRTLQRQEPPFEVTVVGDGFACLEGLAVRSYSLVLLDYSLPRMNGLTTLERIRAGGGSVPVVMVTGQGDERVAVEAMKAGAADYLIKTAGYLTTLPSVLHKAVKQHALALENARLYAEVQRRLRETESLLADLKAAQEQLVRGATLRALGELASGAAHHLNNLLMVMLGQIQLLLPRAGSAALRGPLGIIERAASDAAEVVRRMQRFAQSRPVEERRPVDLNQVAAEVLEMTRVRWRDAVQAQGIPIEVILEAGVIPLVRGNAAALREVVTNLVLNAVDALPQGGRIILRTYQEAAGSGQQAAGSRQEAGGSGQRAAGRRQEAAGSGQQAGEVLLLPTAGCMLPAVVLEVTDTGVGMPEEVKQRALEPFFTTKGPRSTGLGLSVNYGIIKEHGGELEIVSAEGQGTTIRIRLPVLSPSEERPSPIASSVPAGAGLPLRILVIDDDQEVRNVLASLLAVLGHTVRQAAGGREALAWLEAGAPVDLVLTDLGMPEMTGWEVARAIQALRPRLPVGLVTGWGSQGDAIPEDHQVIAFRLSKPFRVEALQEAIAGCRGRQESRA